MGRIAKTGEECEENLSQMQPIRCRLVLLPVSKPKDEPKEERDGDPDVGHGEGGKPEKPLDEDAADKAAGVARDARRDEGYHGIDG